MEQAPPFLPLNFYCRNARLCQKKAAFARRSHTPMDELSHLRKFDSLVSATIPSHPHFSDKKSDKQIAELQLSLSDVRKRILDLESLVDAPSKSGNCHKSERSTPRSLKPTSVSPASAARSYDHSSPKSSLHRSFKSPAVASTPHSKPKYAAEFPKKLQQGWGVWTANPSNCAQESMSVSHRTILTSSSCISPPLRSPPPSNKSKQPQQDNHLSRSMDNLATKPADVKPMHMLLPDPRAEAILGGCALLATHLQSFEDRQTKIADLDSSFDTLNSSPSSRRTAGDATVDGSGEWFSGKLVGTPRSRDRERRSLTVDVEEDVDDQLARSPDHQQKEEVSRATTAGRTRFRFASDFLQRRLQAQERKMNRRHVEDDDDGGRKSPASAPVHDQQQLEARLQRLRAAPSAYLPPDDRIIDEIGSDAERPSTAAILRSTPRGHRRPSRDAIPGDPTSSIRGTPRKHNSGAASAGFLSMMDKAVRHAVDSDSDSAAPSSNTTSPPRQHSNNSTAKPTATLLSTRSVDITTTGAGAPSATPLIQGLQVDALEKKIGSLQGLVGDLKESIDSFTSRVEEDGDSWQNRMVVLEKQIKEIRDEREMEIVGVKGRSVMKEEVKARLDEMSRRLSEMESESNLQRLMETMMESLRRLVGTAVSDVLASVDDKISQSVQGLTKSFNSTVEAVEVGISKELENLDSRLRQVQTCVNAQIDAAIDEKIGRLPQGHCGNVAELASDIREKISSEIRAESERWRKMEAQHIEALFESENLRRMKAKLAPDEEANESTGGAEKAMAGVREELRLVWSEVQLLTKSRDELKSNVQKLSQIAEQAKEAINKEHALLKTENTSLMKQVQYFKKESMETRAQVQEMKKEMDMDIGSLRAAMGRLKEEGEKTKDSVCRLQRAVSEDLVCEQRSLQRVVERMKAEIGEAGGSMATSVGRERVQIMERIEKLSKLYLGGLEKVRQELDDTKIACTEKMAALESAVADLAGGATEESLRELLLDGFETRISHLENKLEAQSKLGLQEEKAMAKVQSLLAMIQQEREQAASELASVREHSFMVQSSKDAAAEALSELLRIRDHVEEEKKITISVIADVKAKTGEYHEGLAKELRSGMRNSIVVAEKETETALTAAARAAAAAEAAEAALGEIFEVRRKSSVLSEDVEQAVTHARRKCNEELKGHIEKLAEEVSRARSHVDGIEEDRRKSVGHIEGWKQTMQEEVSKARSVIHGIEQEKRKSLSMAEAAVIQEKHRFEKHVKEAETTMQDVMKAVAESRSAMETKMQSAGKKQAELEERERKTREEMAELRQGLAEALRKVEDAAKEEEALGHSVAAWSQKYEAACKVFQEIEKRLCALEKVTVVEVADAAVAKVTSAEKQRLVALYKELSALLRRTRSKEEEEEGIWEERVDAKLLSLDTRIEQVECAGLRALEARTEVAMEGAAEAQQKCSALGVEVLKLLRMLAPQRKEESPCKSRKEEISGFDITVAENSGSRHHHHPHAHQQHHHGHGNKAAKSSSDAHGVPCSYCSRRSGNSKTNNNVDDGPVDSFRLHPAAEAMDGTGNRQQHRYDMETDAEQQGSRNSSPVQWRRKGGTQGEEDYGSAMVRKKENADLKVLEGRLPITHDLKLNKDKDKNCQSTNIRLEAGKIHVNVSHRSAVLSSAAPRRGEEAPDNNISVYAA